MVADQRSADAYLQDLLLQSMEADVISDEGAGFLAVLSRKGQNVQNDIPVVFETYGLLAHFLAGSQAIETELNETAPTVDLTPAIHYDRANRRVLLLAAIGAGELPLIAYWMSDRLPSKKVQSMPGLLAVPFCIETQAGTDLLIPEWYASFYVDSTQAHCVPILTLRSMLSNETVSQDWVRAALLRMRVFALPQEDAIKSSEAALKTTE